MNTKIHLSEVFGMGFWIDEDGTLMSCPAFEDGGFDVDNQIAVEDWEDPNAYSRYALNHLEVIKHGLNQLR